MKLIAVFCIIILLIAFIIFGPLAFIWSLNTLFPVLNITYAFNTWVAAAFIMFGLLGSTVGTYKNSK